MTVKKENSTSAVRRNYSKKIKCLKYALNNVILCVLDWKTNKWMNGTNIIRLPTGPVRCRTSVLDGQSFVILAYSAISHVMAGTSNLIIASASKRCDLSRTIPVVNPGRKRAKHLNHVAIFKMLLIRNTNPLFRLDNFRRFLTDTRGRSNFTLSKMSEVRKNVCGVGGERFFFLRRPLPHEMSC